MKGKVIEDTVDVKISDIDKKNKRKVSFDTEALEEKNDMDKIMEENFPNQGESSDDMKNANVKGKVVVVEQLYSEPVEDFDIAYKEDLVKMKELGLPLGFLNVSPYDVDANNGLIEVPQKRSLKGGKSKKKKRVVDDDMREEFDRDWEQRF